MPAAVVSHPSAELSTADAFGDIPDTWIGFDGWPEAELLAELRHHSARIQHSGVEIGKILLRVKRTMPHGTFGGWLEAQGVEARAAQRFMVAAAFAYKHPKIAAEIAGLAERKQRLIASLPEEVLEGLAEGHEIGGLSVTRIVSGEDSYAELQETVARLREAHAKDDEVRGKLVAENRDLKAKLFDKERTMRDPAKVEELYGPQLEAAFGKMKAALDEIDIILDVLCPYVAGVGDPDLLVNTSGERVELRPRFIRQIETTAAAVEVNGLHSGRRWRTLMGLPDADAVYARVLALAADLPDDMQPKLKLLSWG